MNHAKSNVWAAAGVVGAALALFVGNTVRDRVDVGQTRLKEAPISNMVASLDNRTVPEGDYFHSISDLLKKEYVEPIADEGKLATGAVRGMVLSLGDPKSVFMDKREFQAFLKRRQGTYEGIGADLELVMSGPLPKVQPMAVSDEGPAIPEPSESVKIPRVVVVNVVPGGPADRAGVKVGDVVDTVDKHWVVSPGLIERFRKANRDWMNKKISLEQLNKVRTEVREKTERNMMPLRAKEKLVVGTDGAVEVTWARAGALRKTTLTRAVTKVPNLTASGNEFKLPLVSGAAEALKKAIAGKSKVTLDLTGNVNGDFGEMKRALSVLAPNGRYGSITTQREGKGSALMVTDGNPDPPKVTVKVDETTRGSAEILALALASKGAVLTGRKSGGDRSVVEIVQLPDGSGYTLLTGTYVATAGGKK